MNRRLFIKSIAVGCVAGDQAVAGADRSGTLSVVVVSNGVDMDINPGEEAPLLSVRLHGLVTDSLTPEQRQACEAKVRELLGQRAFRFRTYGTANLGGGETLLIDVPLQKNRSLSGELLAKGLALLDPKAKPKRPDLIAAAKANGGKSAKPAPVLYRIEKPEDRTLHPSLKRCLSAEPLTGLRYLTFGTGSADLLQALVSEHVPQSQDTWSLNVCFRVRAGGSDGSKIVLVGAKTNKIPFWMYFEKGSGSVVFGNAEASKGSFVPNFGRWQILSYCRNASGDDVLVDGKVVATFPPANEPCKFVIVPPPIPVESKPTSTDIQFVEWSNTKAVVGRSSIRNLDYVPRPMFAALAEAYAEANHVFRNGEVGAVTGLAVQGASGLTFTITADAVPGKGDVLISTDRSDSAFRESCRVAHMVARIWANGRGFNASKIDFMMSHGTTGTAMGGNSSALATALAMISALSGYAVDSSAATTGTLDVRGNVGAVGGVAEKTLAALRDRKVSIIVVPRSVAPQLKAAFLTDPDRFLSHQVIAINHINQAIGYLMVRTGPNGRAFSVEKRVNDARALVVRAMDNYRSLLFGEAVRCLEQAATLCPEDIVIATWIDLINRDYQRIVKESNDY